MILFVLSSEFNRFSNLGLMGMKPPEVVPIFIGLLVDKLDAFIEWDTFLSMSGRVVEVVEVDENVELLDAMLSVFRKLFFSFDACCCCWGCS